MDKYLVAPQLISKLEQEKCFRHYFSLLLKVLACICTVTAIIAFFLGWKELFAMSSEGMIGGTFYQLAFAVATYLIVHCILIRAAQTKTAADKSPAALGVSITLSKLVGETWGLASALLGAGAALYVWIAGREAGILLKHAAAFFPFLKTGNGTFTDGATLAFKGTFYGASVLLLGYLLAEILKLLADYAGRGKEGSP